ncbi:hypothetical protein [Sphingomonas sp. 3-13AW]
MWLQASPAIFAMNAVALLSTPFIAHGAAPAATGADTAFPAAFA